MTWNQLFRLVGVPKKFQLKLYIHVSMNFTCTLSRSVDVCVLFILSIKEIHSRYTIICICVILVIRTSSQLFEINSPQVYKYQSTHKYRTIFCDALRNMSYPVVYRVCLLFHSLSLSFGHLFYFRSLL